MDWGVLVARYIDTSQQSHMLVGTKPAPHSLLIDGAWILLELIQLNVH